ncbi:MAG: pyruvate formate-lyase-activating protein [Oscillospiraceae bacterium]
MSTELKNIVGKIHSIESFGAVDGPGLRFVVFMQGCPLRCVFCHNADTWNLSDGKDITAGEIVDRVKEYTNFIKKGGVTLSGGEPLFQPEFSKAIITLCKQNGFHTAIDTSGGVPLDVAKPVIDEVDMLLLDIKDIDKSDCINLTGQSNENAMAILNYCDYIGKPVWIRHVIIPTLTLQEHKLNRLAKTLSWYSCIQKVELIPFHKMGEYKWEYVDKQYTLTDIEPPTQDEMNFAKEIFKNYGLPL